MASTPALHAWVDESMQTRGLAEGIYLLAATVADPSVCDEVRIGLRQLLIGKAKRLHWRDETLRRQLVIANAVGSLDLAHTVVIGAPLDGHRQERARRLCMEHLVHELEALGVAQVWIEKRNRADNARDTAMVRYLRARRVLTSAMRVDFALPEQEPMLWLPDAVAGAVGMNRKGEDSRPHAALAGRITEHAVVLS